MYASIREYKLSVGINTLRLPMYSNSFSFMVLEETPKLFVMEPELVNAWEERKFLLVAGSEVFAAEEILSPVGCFPDEPMFWHLYEMMPTVS